MLTTNLPRCTRDSCRVSTSSTGRGRLGWQSGPRSGWGSSRRASPRGPRASGACAGVRSSISPPAWARPTWCCPSQWRYSRGCGHGRGLNPPLMTICLQTQKEKFTYLFSFPSVSKSIINKYQKYHTQINIISHILNSRVEEVQWNSLASMTSWRLCLFGSFVHLPLDVFFVFL